MSSTRRPPTAKAARRSAPSRSATTTRRPSTSRPRSESRSAPSRGPSGRGEGAASAASRRPAPAGARRRVTKRTGVSPLRVAILAAILVILSITLVPTIHSYLHQRSQIGALQQHIEHQRQEVKDLQQQRARWNDPQYVEQRARQRLKFVFPGEKSYTVLDDRGKRPASTGEPGVAEVNRTTQHQKPWWSQVWTSVQLADSGAHQQTPTAPQKTKQPPPQLSKPLPPIRDHQNK